MSGKKVKLGEICDFINGGAWSDKEYVSYGIPVLKVSNFKPNGFSVNDINYLPVESAEKYRKNELKLDDVIIATVGSHPTLKDSAAGRSCVINSRIVGFYLNQNAVCLRTKNKNILNQRYLGFLVKTPSFLHYIQSSGRGAANQMRIAIGTIKEYEFVLPQIEIQGRIADILSAYYDLIENNQKQIKLLEEAAQRLYKEWFMDLRFPGYEHTKIVDGVPEGWERGTLDNIVNQTGKNMKKDARQEYAYYLPIDCLPKKSIGYVDTNDIKLAESSLVSFDKGDIIFGAMRPYFHKVVVARDKGLTRSTCFVLNSRSENMWGYVTMLLFDNETIEYATQISIGTTMPYVRWKDMKLMPVLIPNKQIATSFDSLVKPIINRVGLLAHHISELGQARNRLLPKLMSGEVEV